MALLGKISNAELDSKIRSLAAEERRITAELVELLREADDRRLYLELGHTSLFGYLVDGMGFAPASAQRRIDAARLSKTVPELAHQISTGELNLSQVSIVAQGLRDSAKAQGLRSAKKALADERLNRKLLNRVRSKKQRHAQLEVARELELPVLTAAKQRVQSDESVRVEVTFSKAQFENLQRVKEIISHTLPNPTFSELAVFLAEEFLKTVKRASAAEVPERQARRKPKAENVNQRGVKQGQYESRSRYIRSSIRQSVHVRDESCCWIDPKTGGRCGSRFQLQVDHIVPFNVGGSNEPANLQLLCASHNRHKARLQEWTGFAVDFDRDVDFEMYV
ncbi:MAG TPA: HNH endonuclease signature motif containing protein [Bdellovibrionales bacterium]|nr:HNH endonuclease signature motif containing protein [Bdellovibrionales bacterium]